MNATHNRTPVWLKKSEIHVARQIWDLPGILFG